MSTTPNSDDSTFIAYKIYEHVQIGLHPAPIERDWMDNAASASSVSLSTFEHCQSKWLGAHLARLMFSCILVRR